MIIRTDGGAAGGSEADTRGGSERERTGERIKSWTVPCKPEKNCEQGDMVGKEQEEYGMTSDAATSTPAGLVHVPSRCKYLLASEKLGSTNDVIRHTLSSRDNAASYGTTISRVRHIYFSSILRLCNFKCVLLKSDVTF